MLAVGHAQTEIGEQICWHLVEIAMAVQSFFHICSIVLVSCFGNISELKRTKKRKMDPRKTSRAAKYIKTTFAKSNTMTFQSAST